MYVAFQIVPTVNKIKKKQKEQKKYQIEVAGGVGRGRRGVAEEKCLQNRCLWIGHLKEKSSVVSDLEYGRQRASNQGRKEEGIYFFLPRDVGWSGEKKQIKKYKK